MPTTIRSRVRVALTVGLVVVSAGCGWGTLGFDASRTGSNTGETRIAPGNVASLQEAWHASIGPGPADFSASPWSPVVASGVAVVGTRDGVVRAFDTRGITGCSGSPRTCLPVWRANVGGEPLVPTIAGGVVYVTSGGVLRAFDAAGTTNCSGSPRTCLPLWTASPALDSPVVGQSVVYVSTGTRVAAFDAAGTTNCSGSPKTCRPLWTSTPAGCTGTGTQCRFSAPSLSGGRVYATWAGDAGLGQAALQAFDAAGLTACSGVPRQCAPLWNVSIRGNQPTPPPVIADGRVFVLANFLDTLQGNSPGAWLEAHDAATGALAWDAQLFGTYASPPVVAGGRLYLPAGRILVYDATGVQGCGPNGSSRRCNGLFAVSGEKYDLNGAVANGILYTGSMPFNIEGLTFPAAVRAFDVANLTTACGQFGACPPAWTSPDLGSTTSAPVVTDGRVYVAATAGSLHAYRLP